jgi:DNA polymerase elongation subunit (family B)
MCNVLGKEQAIRLSPLRKINFTEWNTAQPIELGGINHLDYILLFKKFIVKQEPSYKLNDIGEKYVKMGKIEYEGSLDRLFNSDIKTFIKYNLRDVEIIIELEKKFKFIDLTVAICHLCHVPYEQIYLSTVLNDGAILTYLKRQNIVSPNKPTTINPALKESTRDDYAGGYLKDPIPGLYQWVIDLDFTSLYPSIIRSLNMGIETLVGRIVNNGKYDNQWSYAELIKMDSDTVVTIEKLNENFTTTRTQVKVGKIIKLIKDNKWMIAASGAIFRTDKSSVVCEVLTDWFNKRKHYKKLMSEAYKADNKDLGDHYHRLQHAYKIKLNDVYGCYAINSWRYTDGHKMISSAITLTGQRVIQESITFVNKWLNTKLKTTDIDYVVTSDTDSLFIQVKDLLIAKGVDLDNKPDCIKAVLEIATEIQSASNEFVSKFANDSFNLDHNFFELKQEVVIERSYHSGKRRYAMLIVNKEGVDTEEMIMMGLDLMKSNMPPLYKKFGQSLLTEIMSGIPKPEIDKRIINFKASLNDLPWVEISKPTGVKQINSYIAKRPSPGEIFSEFKLKAPINTKSAVYYNDLLKFKKLDKKYSKFVEGDKMKYVLLKPNPYNIDTMGLRGNGEDPEFIIDFINQYIDREEAFNTVLLNKLKGTYDDIGWGNEFPILNTKINRFFKF